MVIALDYDNTYSADKELWRSFIVTARTRGHTIICVSGRDEEPLHRDALTRDLPSGIRVILCSHRTKRTVVKECGVSVDVWIDDFPEGIVEAAAGCS